MPPRRTATTTVEPTETETETEKVEVDKSQVMSWIKEAIGDLGLGSKPVEATEPTETTATEPEEIESPRQQESRMRQQVEAALPALHIHVDRDDRDDKKNEKPEPELTPGKKPLLQRMIGLNP